MRAVALHTAHDAGLALHEGATDVEAVPVRAHPPFVLMAGHMFLPPLVLAATPATEKAATESAPGQEAGAATPAQLTVQQHVAEYALAGSLDGLRTGLGQSVGGQVNVFVSAALQSTAKVISFAFASAICAYRERQVSLPIDF